MLTVKPFPIKAAHFQLLVFASNLLGMIIISRCATDIGSSNLIKYGFILSFFADKILLFFLPSAPQNYQQSDNTSNIQRIINSFNPFFGGYHSNGNSMNIGVLQNLSLIHIIRSPGLFIAITPFICLLELMLTDKFDTLYAAHISVAAFIVQSRIYADWICALEAFYTQVIILHMNYLYYTVFRISDVFMTIGCESFLIFFFFLFGDKDKYKFIPLFITLFLSFTFGISMPIMTCTKKMLQHSNIIRFIGQTQGFFAFNMILTLKSLFFGYNIIFRILIFLSLPFLVVKLFSQISYLLSGPYTTKLKIDCKGSGHKYYQLPQEAVECKIVFLNYETNWACDQMDITSKINSDIVFTYELHHGALVSIIEAEYRNEKLIYNIRSTNRGVLIFALYVSKLYLKQQIELQFDLQKYYQLNSQLSIDHQIIKYEHFNYENDYFRKSQSLKKKKRLEIRDSEYVIEYEYLIRQQIFIQLVYHSLMIKEINIPYNKVLSDLYKL